MRIPYSPQFLEQVEKGNVKRISSTGETVNGEFKKEVTYPPDDKEAEPAKQLRHRDPDLRQHGGAVEAAAGQGRDHLRRADQPRPRRADEHHRRLRPGDPARRPVRVPRAARGRRADERAGRLRALPRAARGVGLDEGHVRRRGGDRRGQVRAHRGRRLPQEPRPLPAPRRAHPARRAALRAPRHRQDAARARGGGGGQRAVLLDLRVGVRRGDRRHRRLARARPLQAGQGVPARDHLHRRDGRDRPLALRRRDARSAAATTSASRRSTRSSPRWTASSPARR